jgi:hypothetical protein
MPLCSRSEQPMKDTVQIREANREFVGKLSEIARPVRHSACDLGPPLLDRSPRDIGRLQPVQGWSGLTSTEIIIRVRNVWEGSPVVFLRSDQLISPLISGGVPTQRSVDQPADQALGPTARFSRGTAATTERSSDQRKQTPQRFRPHNELCRAILKYILHHA